MRYVIAALTIIDQKEHDHTEIAEGRGTIVPQITVALGRSEFRSNDEGLTWSWSPRSLPEPEAPVVHGFIDPAQLPEAPEHLQRDWLWDYVIMVKCGFAVATGHGLESPSRQRAAVFVSSDHAKTWHQVEPRFPIFDRARHLMLTRPEPAEAYHSVVVANKGWFALGWDDPWLLDSPHAHCVCSHDRGATWKYYCFRHQSAHLTLDGHDRLLSLNDGFFLVSHDGAATWQRRDYSIDWPGNWARQHSSYLGQMAFLSPEVGYALVLHWKSDPDHGCPPRLGLIKTMDGGSHWHHIAVLEGFEVVDVNARHVLSLSMR